VVLLAQHVRKTQIHEFHVVFFNEFLDVFTHAGLQNRFDGWSRSDLHRERRAKPDRVLSITGRFFFRSRRSAGRPNIFADCTDSLPSDREEKAGGKTPPAQKCLPLP
jgi:hypothetical protein